MRNWINHRVKGSVKWPKKKILIKFKGVEIVLMPSSENHVSSLSFRVIDKECKKIYDYYSQLYLFLSLLCFRENKGISLFEHSFEVKGNPEPNPILSGSGIVDECTNKTDYFVTNFHYNLDSRQKLALAYFREGKNSFGMSYGYQFFNFYKILMLAYRVNGDGKPDLTKATKGLTEHAKKLTGENIDGFFKEAKSIRDSIAHEIQDEKYYPYNPDQARRSSFLDHTFLVDLENAVKNIMEKEMHIYPITD